MEQHPDTLTPARVDAYLARIGATRPARPDHAALAALHRAHLLAVPFENLGIHLGEPVTLEPEALYGKLVERRRGGFCYELNGLFAELLRSLGFEVTVLAARVYAAPDRLSIPFDHLALRVDLADGPRLADVGFGAFIREPLRLDLTDPQQDQGGTFTVRPDGEYLVVSQDGEAQYRLEQQPRQLADFVPTCWWHTTSPGSHFTRSLICSRQLPEGRLSLSGTRLIHTSGDGTRTVEELTGPEALAAYDERFGFTLPRLPEVLHPPA
ncbi:arylamine N-acetyltransferase [Kitasatospora sp. NPDC096147]|uniref:arylamine N-acetyltransferase family protein n=1 Tax=Kitasatospora sp. NPDC096147 TaxID=3364093 RepID=UPI003829C13D